MTYFTHNFCEFTYIATLQSSNEPGPEKGGKIEDEQGTYGNDEPNRG